MKGVKSMPGNILTYFTLEREGLWQLWILNKGDLDFCICSTHCGFTK